MAHICRPTSSFDDEPLATMADAAPETYGPEAGPPGDCRPAEYGEPQCAATSECGGGDTPVGYGTGPTIPAGGGGRYSGEQPLVASDWAG